MATDPILQPFTLKHLTLRNRVMSSSHEPAYTDGRMPGDRYVAYQEEKARGGIGLTMFGGSTTVSIDSPAAFGNIDASTDAVIAFYERLAAAVHRHGAAVMNQITHLGRRTSWSTEHWLPIVSASSLREIAHRMFPKEAEKEDIDRIARDYGKAARRSKDGGLDGIEIESYGHLFDSFTSPRTTSGPTNTAARWRTACASGCRCWTRSGGQWGMISSSGYGSRSTNAAAVGSTRPKGSRSCTASSTPAWWIS